MLLDVNSSWWRKKKHKGELSASQTVACNPSRQCTRRFCPCLNLVESVGGTQWKRCSNLQNVPSSTVNDFTAKYISDLYDCQSKQKTIIIWSKCLRFWCTPPSLGADVLAKKRLKKSTSKATKAVIKKTQVATPWHGAARSGVASEPGNKMAVAVDFLDPFLTRLICLGRIQNERMMYIYQYVCVYIYITI